MNSPSSLATTGPQPSRMWRFRRERLVLREDVDVPEIGVDAVGERDIDNAVLAGEGDRGLGSIASEGKETFAGATGQQNTKRISHGGPSWAEDSLYRMLYAAPCRTFIRC